jgi:hypothetical protein
MHLCQSTQSVPRARNGNLCNIAHFLSRAQFFPKREKGKRVLLIAAAILAARKLAQYDAGEASSLPRVCDLGCGALGGGDSEGD